MKLKQALFSLLLFSCSGILSVDLGNFEYISAKYQPYCPSKQVFFNGQNSEVSMQEQPRGKASLSNVYSIDPIELSKAVALGVVIVGSLYLGRQQIRAINERYGSRLSQMDDLIAAANARRTGHQNK